MCDCYYHHCENPGCSEHVDFHIGGFDFPRSAFKIWCMNCIESADKKAVVFFWRERNKPCACAIIGPEVGGDGDNHPNVGKDIEEMTVSEWLEHPVYLKWRKRQDKAIRKNLGLKG